VSDFIHNLVRRAAGFASPVALQLPYMPQFAPDLTAEHIPGSEMAFVDEITPERSIRDATTSPQASSGEIAAPVPGLIAEQNSPSAPTAEKLHRQSKEPAPIVSSQPEISTVGAQMRESIKPVKTQFDPETKRSITNPVVQSFVDTLASEQPLDLPSQSPTQPPFVQPAPQPQTDRYTFEASKGGPAAEQTKVPESSIVRTPETLEPEAVAKIQPAIPYFTTKSHPMIRPTPPAERIPTFPTKGSITKRSESRTVQVRIGTVEIKATTPLSPPAPSPQIQGFDNYLLVRTYVNR
jgi:hypothetical protein